MFINFDHITGFSINSYRNNGYWHDSIVDFVQDAPSVLACCCPLAGALDALEDGSLWDDPDQGLLEELHQLIREYQETQP